MFPRVAATRAVVAQRDIKLESYISRCGKKFALMRRPPPAPAHKKARGRERKPPDRGRRRRGSQPAHSPAPVRPRIGAVRAVPDIDRPWLERRRVKQAQWPIRLRIMLCAQPGALSTHCTGHGKRRLVPRQGFRDGNARAVGRNASSITTDRRRLFRRLLHHNAANQINGEMRDLTAGTVCRHRGKHLAESALRERLCR